MDDYEAYKSASADAMENVPSDTLGQFIKNDRDPGGAAGVAATIIRARIGRGEAVSKRTADAINQK